MVVMQCWQPCDEEPGGQPPPLPAPAALLAEMEGVTRQYCGLLAALERDAASRDYAAQVIVSATVAFRRAANALDAADLRACVEGASLIAAQEREIARLRARVAELEAQAAAAPVLPRRPRGARRGDRDVMLWAVPAVPAMA